MTLRDLIAYFKPSSPTTVARRRIYRGYQFGFVWLFGRYWSTDPIGDLIAWVENVISRIKYPGKYDERYNHHLWSRWDGFYRCRLNIPHLIGNLERGRHG